MFMRVCVCRGVGAGGGPYHRSEALVTTWHPLPLNYLLNIVKGLNISPLLNISLAPSTLISKICSIDYIGMLQTWKLIL